MCFCKECVAKRQAEADAEKKAAKTVVPIFSTIDKNSGLPLKSFVFSTPSSRVTIDVPQQESFFFEGSHVNGSTKICFKRTATNAITSNEPASKKPKYVKVDSPTQAYDDYIHNLFNVDSSSDEDENELEELKRKSRELKTKMMELEKKRKARKEKKNK